MEEPKESKVRVRLIFNIVIWAGLIAYLAYGAGLQEKPVFDGGKRIVADVLVNSVDALGVSPSTLPAQVAAGELYFSIGDHDSAFPVLEAALPWIENFDNVKQRRYSNVYFMLGEIEGEKAEYHRAEDFLLQGLTLEPQNFHYQLYLGDIYTNAGKEYMARDHYTALLEIPSLEPEQEALIRISSAKNGDNDLYAAEVRNTLTEMTYLDYPLITLIPINNLPDTVPLQDICLILEPVFRMGCVVQKPLTLSKEVSGEGGKQIDAARVLPVLESTYPRSGFAPIVGIIADDMYSGTANFVFSLQAIDTGYGVVSTFRLFQEDLGLLGSEQLNIRRLAIQLISVVGQLLRSLRPIQPYCPLAYPNSLDEFLQKRASLCPVTRKVLEELLAEIGAQDGVHFSRFSESEVESMLRVKSKYGIDE